MGFHTVHRLNGPQMGLELVSINIATLDTVNSSSNRRQSVPMYMDGWNGDWCLEPKRRRSDKSVSVRQLEFDEVLDFV